LYGIAQSIFKEELYEEIILEKNETSCK